jgi:xanthine dehydrogenase YagR molybdenum-binding subunit
VIVLALEVDTATGRVRATDGWMGLAAGRIMAPPIARSQGLGGFIQGLSYALYEERRLDPKTGIQLTTNLEDYRIIGVGDTPNLEIAFDETPLEGVRGGGAGLSELATVGVAGAVGNAFAHATGVRLRSIPLRPDRVLEALRS